MPLDTPRGESGSRRLRRSLPVLVFAAAALGVDAAAVAGQSATVTVEENFRAAPNGTVLARVQPGAAVAVEAVRSPWVQVRLEGWIWEASLLARTGGSFDLVVAPAGGENLRSEPNGSILARLGRGTLLDELERRPGWVRVRRVGWIWAASLERQGGAGGGRAADARAHATSWLRAARPGGAILSAPDGDTLARVAEGTELQVLARAGNWARVRIEGWTWTPGLAGGEKADTAAPLELGPETLAAEPDRYRGRLVSWRLQFISLERAERVRTDFYEGEPFILARTAEPRSRFAYVAVPPERLSEVERLAPLQWITVVGRVRTGAAALTGSPIIDLLEMRREAAPRPRSERDGGPSR